MSDYFGEQFEIIVLEMQQKSKDDFNLQNPQEDPQKQRQELLETNNIDKEKKDMSGLAVTHVGSLPRRQRVVDQIFAREKNKPWDRGEFDGIMAEEVAETVLLQQQAGVTIVSDGETSKISYATYVKDRYYGFAGDSPRQPPADLKEYPSFLEPVYYTHLTQPTIYSV